MNPISLETFYSNEFVQELASTLEQPNAEFSHDYIINLARNLIRILSCELNHGYIGHQGQCINYAYYFLYMKPMQESSYFEPFIEIMIEFNFMDVIARAMQRLNDARLLDDNESYLKETYVILCNILIYYGDESVLFRQAFLSN